MVNKVKMYAKLRCMNFDHVLYKAFFYLMRTEVKQEKEPERRREGEERIVTETSIVLF